MKTDNREKMLMLAVGLAMAIFLGDRYVLTPLQKLWTDRASRITTLRAKLDKNQLRLARENYLHARWQSMRTNTLPGSVSIAESKLQVAMDNWRQASGITVSSLKPQWRQNQEDYTVLECQAEANGGMKAVAQYLYAMERDSLPLSLENVSITARDPEGQQLTLHVSFTALQLTNNVK